MKNKQFSVRKPHLGTLIRLLVILFMLITIVLSSPLVAGENGSMFFLVRHAEKVRQGDDPGLSPAGEQRAEILASLLADTDIERIHSTDFIRTRLTVTPLAMRLGIGIELYDPSQPEDLVMEMQKSGGHQLVVGHSNTVPDLVQQLGGNGGPEIDEALEYDRLYLVTIDGEGVVSTFLLRYGTPFNP